MLDLCLKVERLRVLENTRISVLQVELGAGSKLSRSIGKSFFAKKRANSMIDQAIKLERGN